VDLFKLKKRIQRLFLEGVGYKIWKKKLFLRFKLGFSKIKTIAIPCGIDAHVFKAKKLILFGIFLQKVTLFKDQIRLLKLPDPYKRKGIRIYKEFVKLKQGKKK